MPEVNIMDFFNQIVEHFNPEAAKGIDANVQFLLSGNQAANYVLEIKEQKCTFSEGLVEKPNLTLKGDTHVVIKILSGEMDGMKAYLMGKIKLIGNISLAMKLLNLFNK